MMHPDQLRVPAATVRALVAEQFPEWSGLELRELRTQGTVNAIFRIGDGLAARFPLRPADAGDTRRALAAEAEATHELRRHTRFPAPEPVALGEPGLGYPLPWSVQTWLSGATATDDDPGASLGFAHDLAELIGELRAIDTRGRTFDGDNRGGDLQAHDDWVTRCLERSEGLLEVARLRALWSELRELPRRAPDAMTHGDLIPGNVLVADGRLAGILDAGGFGAADPALDLVAAWHLLDDEPRDALRAALACDDLEWERGRAWAFEQAIGVVWYYAETNPPMAAMGRRTLGRLVG